MKQNSMPKQKIFFVLTLFALIPSLKNRRFKSTLQQHIFLWMFFLMTGLYSVTTNAQVTPNPVFFTWESEVGCIEGETKRSYEESIAAGICHYVCQGRTVKYNLSGAGLSNTTWIVVGGTILSQTVNQCTVKWSSTASTGAIGVTTNTPTGIVELVPICVEIKTAPYAFFGKDGQEMQEDPLVICRNTTVNFTNMSDVNGGSPINAYLWDFGDGGTSTATSPSYKFAIPGDYQVILRVTNQCYCSSEYIRNVIVTEERVIEITCPTVVCEGQSAIYSISEEYQCEEYNWSVAGGTIISDQPYTNTIEVLWEPQNNQSDEDGFGYVTFNPERCEVECFKPTTVKIPIIRSEGTILGKGMICGSAQELYTMPQWPSTDFQWTLVNSGGANASLVLTGQRNEVMINSGDQAGSFTLSCQYQNTLLKCGGTASITVQVRIPAIIQGSRIVCLQESATTEIYDLEGGHSATWRYRKLPNGPLSAPLVGTSVNPQFLSAGDYSITASGSMFCKTETFLVKVIDPAPLNPSGLTTSTVICPSTPSIFTFTNTVQNSELYWEVTGGSIIGDTTGNSVEVVFNYPTAQPYTLKLKRLVNGCFSPELVIPLSLPLIPEDIKGVTASDPPVLSTCGSTSQIYTMPFVGADSYTWRIDPPAVGSISSGNGSNSVTVLWNEYSNPTSATLFVDVKNCGITTTQSIVVIVGSPVITMTPITTPICSQNSHPFSLVSTPALTSGTVVWDFGDGGPLGSGTSTNHTYNINDTSPTSYTVTATINNPNGCTSPLVVTQVVNVAIAPVALVTPAVYKTKCSFSEFLLAEKELSATLQSGYGATTGIQWYKDDILISGATGNTYVVTGFGKYHVEVTNGTCSSRSNKVVFEQNCGDPDLCTITPDPNLTLVTSGDCGAYNATATYTGSPTILWSQIGNVSSNATSASYNFSKAGYYSISYQAVYSVNGSPCVASISKPITVPYVADLKYKITCPTTGGNYTVELFDSSTYIPSITTMDYKFYVNNVIIPYTSGLQTKRTITLAPGASYSLKIIIEGQGNPACSKTINLNLPNLPNTAFSITPGPYCQDAPIGFTVTNPQPGSTYKWDFAGEFTNTQENPTISFTTGGPKYAKLTVTNSVGCIDSSEEIPVFVTATNFDGFITPELGTACTNGTVNLSFTPDINSLNPVNFQWMIGDEPVPGPNTNPKAVGQSGRYWVRVGTANGCFKDIYNPVAVTVLPPVVPQISGRNAICTGDYVSLITDIQSSGALYKWTLQPPLGASTTVSTQRFFEMELDVAGTYVYSVEVKIPIDGSAFCIGTATHIVTVYDAPEEPSISATLISCQPYTLSINATNVQPGTFTWSNGSLGTSISPTESQIIIHEGGPFQVTFTNLSGCTSSASISVPRSLESYMWIFPTGCIDYCSDKYDDRYLLGPSVMEFKGWEWLIDSGSQASGIEEVANFPVENSGTYNLTLYNENCAFTSGNLNVTNNKCEDCKEGIALNVVDITWDDSPFLFYTLTLEITNNFSTALPLTITTNNSTGVFNPSTIMVQPGTDNYQVQFVPFSGFNPSVGVIEVTLEFRNDGKPCAQFIYMEFPDINMSKEMNSEKDELSIAPNPAKHSTEVQYKFITKQEGAQLVLYDLTGRFLDSYYCNAESGTWQLNTSHLTPGQYIIVMKQQGQVVEQQHLIIKN